MASSAEKVPKVKLNNGHEMPILGLGTWKSKPGEVTQAVKDAIDAGYRHFDCAFVYQNEAEVGQALTEKMASGVVKREELFITSKLWNTFHSPESVEPALKKSLSLLGLDYLDLYLIHWPISLIDKEGELFPKDDNDKLLYKSADHVDTWRAMEKCVEQGLVRSIGLSNFNSKQIQHVLDNCKIKPVVNQVECHPYLNQKRLIDFCKERDIHITAYSPLGSPDRPWAKPEDPSLLADPKIKAIADNYKKSTAQLLIRYQVERGVIVIPKSVTKTRIEQNFDIFDFQIGESDMQYIDSLDCNGRFCHVTWMNDSPDFPFSIEF
ncbi:aldo-keto reductase family 1 member B1-like [Daphnia pulex]|uniref:aldo-keto reductase family 1 member B1-like n=1 Tax=Daphnia pulex TaxID=6669 RepID=UPI001EDEF1D7|nr:aldo-keto reductase family 1 member B1-like [Daphnia pulex]XP_046455159.1 aldo-keto reductase family 1 member B1-like [Daphnia pulex]